MSKFSIRACTALALTLGAIVLVSPPAVAADGAGVTSATFTGGTGTVTLGGTVWAKAGGALTLTVVTTNAMCVDVSGAFTGHQTSASVKVTWTFPFTAPAGDGPRSVTVTAAPAVDAQGNCAGTAGTGQASYSLDNTGPVITSQKTPAANAAGWNNTTVILKWTATDAGVGVAASQPFSTRTLSNEGFFDVSVSSQRDRLGNPSAVGSALVAIDKTKPDITAAKVENPDGSTTVTFTCADSLSEVATCVADGTSPPSDSTTVTGPATVTGTATDNAGNTQTISVDVPAFDHTPPSITHTLSPQPNAAGWNNTDVIVTFACSDDESGVAICTSGGTSPPAESTTVTEEGTTLVTGYAEDNATNSATDDAWVSIDKTAPSITGGTDRSPNSEGWFNADVVVSFDCADELSGVAECTGDTLLSDEGAGQSVHGDAGDVADNPAGTDFGPVNIDKTNPEITAAITSGAVGNDGWYVGPVTVSFTCSDALAGIATCPPPVVLSSNGSDNSATGTATDKAGNTATATLNGIKIDQEKPTLTAAGVNVAGKTYILGEPIPAATCTATDNVSGLATCSVVVTPTASGVGAFGYTATAIDVAGNSTTITGTFKVIYRFDGFMQPIDDPRMTPGATTSIFKAGSAVPVKFQLKRVDGTLVQAAVAPTWLTPVKGSPTNAPVDESVYSDSPDSGSTYRLEAGKYVYNWKSSSGAGFYWRIGVKLDDGQTYYVNVGLR